MERLGGVRTLHVDVRIISSTNRDLHQDVVDKQFREDLFYRLNVFPIDLPSPRQRRADIPILVRHFVHNIPCEWANASTPSRRRLWLCCRAGTGRATSRPRKHDRTYDDLEPRPGTRLATGGIGNAARDADDNLSEMDREHVIRVLLGLKRTTLQSMLRRFGIELQEYRRGNGTFGPS